MDTALRIALTFLPEGVALIVGLVLAAMRRRTDPQTAALAAAGFALHLVAVVLGTVSVYVGTGIRTAADLARFTQLGGVLGLVVIFARLLGWILLLFALFRRLPRAPQSQDNTPTGRHALLDAEGGQVVAEEGQSLYPEDDDSETTGLIGAGTVGAGAGAVGARAFGEDPFGDRPRADTRDADTRGTAPEDARPTQPAGSDAPTEAVPIGRIPLRSRMPDPVTAPPPAAPAAPAASDATDATGGDEDVAEEDVHDPVQDEVAVPAGTDEPGPVAATDEADVDEAVIEDAEEADEVPETDVDEDQDDTDDGGSAEVAEADVDADGDVVSDEAPETADVPQDRATLVVTPLTSRPATAADSPDGSPAASPDGSPSGDTPSTERPPLPALTSTPVLRTDFSDDDAWEVARTAIVGPDDVEAPTNLEVVADPAYTDLTADEAAELATTGEAGAAGEHPCLFLVDATTTAEAGSPVLVVDLRPGSGRSFRCAASEVQTLETILSTTSTTFEELAGAVADDGVFRGV